jgi:asparagine synthase (glutamine-hydrolysing)
MCGISGFVDFNRNSGRENLEKMNRTLTHRGPEGEGYAMFNTDSATIGLGHRRLCIIDLSEGGSQPKTFGSLHITFNGEMYNYAEIRKQLEDKGHQFNSHSDTEVILHAFCDNGPQCMEKFIGMYAFGLYDELKQKLFLFRDRAGVKPLYYYWKDGLLLFGSELKALMEHPSFKKEIDTDAVAAYMQFGYIPAPYSIFKNTHKVNPGHYIELDLQKRSINEVQYWNVYDSYNKPTLKIDLPDAITETERILTNAFQYRMVSDVPVGVFLSGGYDSSCVTALLQRNNTEKIKTFTIGVPDAKMDEAAYAKKVAAHLGTDHTEFYCTEQEALQIVPQLPFFYDEPFADSSAIPTTLVSRIARTKVTVALSADAGDEVFAGYNRYGYIMRYGSKVSRIPKVLSKAMAGMMDMINADSIPYFNKKYLFHSRYEKAKSILANADKKNIFLNLTEHYTLENISAMIRNPVKKLDTAFDSEELKKEYFNMLSYMMAIDYQTYLPDDILHKVDRASMSVSLEGREPFLDHRVIDWVAQLPINFKYNKGSKKFILKEIVHKYIPREIMDRPKMGFGIPINTWLMNDLKPFVDQFFDPAFIEKQGIFVNAEIQKMRSSFYNGKMERSEKVWFMLMFQMWYDKWMNNN